MRTIIEDCCTLLKHGIIKTISYGNNITFSKFLGIVAIFFFLKIVSSLFISTFFFLLHIEHLEYVANQLIRQMNFFQGLITVCIIGPIIEELGFRLCLKYSRRNFAIMCGYFSYMIFWSIFKGMGVIWEREFFFLSLISTLLVVFTIHWSLHWKGKLNIELSKIWTNYPKSIFYCSTFLFGFLHIFNYQISLKILILSPILLLPETLAGVIFSYTRLKYSILYSILLHSVFNTIPFCFQFMPLH